MKNRILLLTVICLVVSSCKKDEPQPTNTNTNNTADNVQDRLNNGETPLEIYWSNIVYLDSLYGKTYQGGLIFYFNTTDGTGIVSADSDQDTLYWGCENTNISGTSTSLGTGEQNTLLIVGGCLVADIAARACYNLVNNGFSDWYLPSKDELNKMYVNLYLNGYGNFVLSSYWSSSQFDPQFAYLQLFNSNTNQYYSYKDLLQYQVRAVRSF